MASLRHAFIPVLCLALALMHGCMASQPTRFFLLGASRFPGEKDDCPGGPQITLGVSPAVLAKYLDRPQLMTRVGPNELRLSELDQWAEPLEDDISRVIAQNLKEFLCAEVISLAGAGPGETDYRVAFEVTRFDGTPGGEAVLEARWSIYGHGDGAPLFTREERFARRVSGHDHKALVSALSSLAATLSREIAGSFRSVRLPGNPEEGGAGAGNTVTPVP